MINAIKKEKQDAVIESGRGGLGRYALEEVVRASPLHRLYVPPSWQP